MTDAVVEPPRDYVAELVRWQESGATWEVVARTRRGLTIALLRCDGGEEVDRFTTDDPTLADFVARADVRKPELE